MKKILSRKIIKNYLKEKLKNEVEILEFSFIGEGYYANGYKVIYKIGNKIKTEFIRVIKPLNSGHEYPIDRALQMIASTSRFVWGESAIDIVAIVARFMNFDLVNFGSLEGPFSKLTKVFIENYLSKTEDEDLLKIMPYAFCFYAIVSSHPVFHPELSVENRKIWIEIGKRLLSDGKFDWKDQNKYLR